MTKVLHIVGSLGWHGVEAVVMNYYRNVDKTKLSFGFVTSSMQKERYDDEVLQLGGEIFRVPVPSRHPIKYMKAIKDILQKNTDYNIVHVHGNSASIYLALRAAKSIKRKVFCIGHSHNASCLIRWQHHLLRPFVNRKCDKRFACSIKAGKWLFKNADYEIMNNAIDLDKFSFSVDAKNEIRNRFGISSEAFVVGNVGGFTQNKNHDFLLKAFYELTKKRADSYLILVGNGALEQDIRTKATELGIEKKVIFFGTTTQIHEVYSAFDVFCLPSLFEGLPLVIVEASACTIPCVVSEAVTKETAVTSSVEFLPTHSPALWAERLLSAVKLSPAEAKQQIQQSGYDIALQAKKLEQFYLSLNS